MLSHTVQLFDSDVSLTNAVATFVCEGLASDDAVMLVTTPSHAESILSECQRHSPAIDAARQSGSLAVHDAEHILARLFRRGDLDWWLFQTIVGRLVHGAKGEHARLRVFGEMVDLLAREGDFAVAERLETFWNRLGQDFPLHLLCGYRAEHFGNPRDGDALRRICAQHAVVASDPHDVLGSFLLKTHAAC